MGTFKGHAIPAAEFIIFSVCVNLIHKAEQLAETEAEIQDCEYASVAHAEDGKPATTEGAGEARNRKTGRIRLLFSLYAMASISTGILYEGLGGVIMEKEGGFFAEIGHLAMYAGFLPAGLAFGLESGLMCGSKQHHVARAPLLSQSAFFMGFANQYLLLDSHATMKKPGADMLFHRLWATSAALLTLVYFISVVAELAQLRRLARASQLACPAFIMLQGVWVLMIGFMEFGGEWREMRVDYPMEHIQAYFGFVLIGVCCLQYCWVELVPPSVARRYQRVTA